MVDTAQRLRNISVDQRKLLAKRLRESSSQVEPIAIIGMSCRFAGAANLDEYWQLISRGIGATAEIPQSRWDVKALYDPTGEQRGKNSP